MEGIADAWSVHTATTFVNDQLTMAGEPSLLFQLIIMCLSWTIFIWVWIYNRCIDFFAVTIAVMVVQHVVIVCCDLTQSLLSAIDTRVPLPPQRRLVCCATTWCVSLVWLAPVVLPILSVKPVLLSWCLTVLSVHAYRALLRLCLGQQKADAMLSMKQLRSYRLQVDLSEYRKDSSTSVLKNCVFYLMLAGYLQANKSQMLRHQMLTLATILCLLYSLYLRNFRRPMQNVGYWRLLWDIRAAPIHVLPGFAVGAAGDDNNEENDPPLDSADAAADLADCDDHSQCAICLDNLCRHQSVLHASSWSLASRRRPMLAVSRLGSLATSATRSWGSSLYKSMNSGPSHYIAELPCRHQFHLGCIDDAARSKLQCPTCRSAIGQAWREMSAPERSILRVGGMVVTTMWLFIRVAESWGLIGSAYLAMTRLLLSNLTGALAPFL